MHIILALVVALFTHSIATAQPKSSQEWQQATISTDAITVSCRQMLLPYVLGRLLVETSPTTVEGEMDSTLRSAHPVRVLLQPQTGTTDTLSAINGCTIDGAVVQVGTADVGDTITVANSATIKFPNAQPATISNVHTILTFVRKGGVWVAAMTGVSGDDIEIANNCAHATAFDALCIDRVQRRIYLGTGTGIVAIGGEGGGEGDGCFGLDECFDLGNTIDGLNGRANALKLLDSNADGFLIYVGASGPVIECVTDFGTVNEAPCIPSGRESFEISPARFAPDGTHFVYAFNVVLNAGRIPVALTPGDDNSAGIEAVIDMPKSWDGVNLIIFGKLHTAEATPGGVIRLDWSGYCVEGIAANGTGAYATETANSVMSFPLDSQPQHRQITIQTVGNVPLSNCVNGDNRTLWLRALVDATATTADNLSQQFFFSFKARYGLKAFSN